MKVGRGDQLVKFEVGNSNLQGKSMTRRRMATQLERSKNSGKVKIRLVMGKEQMTLK